MNPQSAILRVASVLPILFGIDAVAWGEEPGGDGGRFIEDSVIDIEVGREHWSFQPLRAVLPWPVAESPTGWPRTAIDHFVLARLTERGLRPAEIAGRDKLIRRVYFDLLGLPPSPAEVDAFINETSTGAYDNLVNRLLDSEHYGERWARHWLDIARFAESNGFEKDEDRPTAFHYRDFVIKALNQDMPYDQFVRWQLAGDLLAPDEPLARSATGFLVAGVENITQSIKEFERDRYDKLDDMASTVGTAMLGMTIGCARCHNHKYDPITQRDYYRFVASFAKTIGRRSPLTDQEGSPRAYSARDVAEEVSKTELEKFNVFGDKDEYILQAQVHFLARGDVNRKQGIATQSFPRVLTRGATRDNPWGDVVEESVPLRVALANWINDVDHGGGALLARVIVNRIWQHHMGFGIVATPSDFGTRGSLPSHPELLDWLASELIRNQWRLKPIHALIMSSAVYMQTHRHDAQAALLDPDNLLHWHRPVRRLEAEVIRDAMLAVSGMLDPAMYGPGSLDERSTRRSVYFTVKRSSLMPSLQLFDAPDALQGEGSRQATTIAPQALMLLNNERIRSYATAFAKRIDPTGNKKVGSLVQDGFQTALSRDPTGVELKQMVAFVQRQTDSYNAVDRPGARQHAVGDFCQLLLCLNEFVYVE